MNRFLRIAPAIYAFTLLVPLALLAIRAVSFSELAAPRELAIWVLGNGARLPPTRCLHGPMSALGAMTWPLYTIPAGVSFYVVTLLLVLATRRWGFWAMLGPFLALGIVSAVVFAVITPNGLGPDQTVLSKLMSHSLLHRATAFGAGIFWARYWPRIRFRWWLAAVAVVIWKTALPTSSVDIRRRPVDESYFGCRTFGARRPILRVSRLGVGMLRRIDARSGTGGVPTLDRPTGSRMSQGRRKVGRSTTRG